MKACWLSNACFDLWRTGSLAPAREYGQGKETWLQSKAKTILPYTTRNIHFYDENFNNESKTVIEYRFL